jgi:DNA mismatch endonuclease (patch repair protein)
MADNRTPEQRAATMRAVKSKDTGPEWTVRRLLHRLGYRYRLHVKDLPGKPDLVFPRRRLALFVHGCFWHGHGCRIGQLPKSRLDYWRPKIDANAKRDRRKKAALVAAGWRVAVVWQCELADTEALTARLRALLDAH